MKYCFNLIIILSIILTGRKTGYLYRNCVSLLLAAYKSSFFFIGFFILTRLFNEAHINMHTPIICHSNPFQDKNGLIFCIFLKLFSLNFFVYNNLLTKKILHLLIKLKKCSTLYSHIYVVGFLIDGESFRKVFLLHTVDI